MSTGSPSSPSKGGGDDGEGEDGVDEVVGPGVMLPGHRRDGDPSSSRRRSAEAVWPEHFVEAVTVEVAVDAARDVGRLAAAPAAAAVFQVCTAWRALSHSEQLWQELARRVWRRQPSQRLASTWRNEFMGLHRTARNFRARRSSHSHLLPAALDVVCRRVALSNLHLAAGFVDGSVRLFRLVPASADHAVTYGAHPYRDRLGRFSQSVSGLILLSDRLVFASQDGDIHVADIQEPASSDDARRAHEGNLVEDGVLVDFSGDGRWWVGLYAGVPGRSWRVWDGGTEQLLYVGGSLTDLESVTAWHLLTDLSGPGVGRVRLADTQTLVGCTGSMIQSLDLDDPGLVLGDLELQRGAVVSAVDACEGRVMVMEARGVARVRRARTLDEMCRFSTLWRGGVGAGCMNWGYAVACSGGVIRVWDADSGEYLYSFRERVGEASVLAASHRHVVAWCPDTGLHLWDYRPL